MKTQVDDRQPGASDQPLTQMSTALDQKRIVLQKVLMCPQCHGDLRDEQVQHVCVVCGKAYPSERGIPRFLRDLDESEQQVRHSFDHEHQRYRDSRYTRFGPQLVEQWLADVQLPAEYFRNKLVLDVGCGSGRWTFALASLGATVVAVDFTNAGVEVTNQGTGQFENVSVLQADIFNLPLRPESFDFVVSWGVLHHTRDTRAAFERVHPLVRRGGQLYVMIYERHSPVKFFFTNLIRRFLRRLPEDQRYQACGWFLIKNRLLYKLLAHLFICAPYPEPSDPLEITTRQFGLYDAYSPLFNHLHTREEVLSWFHSANFEQLTLTDQVRPPHGAAIRKSGGDGESVKARGVRA